MRDKFRNEIFYEAVQTRLLCFHFHCIHFCVYVCTRVFLILKILECQSTVHTPPYCFRFYSKIQKKVWTRSDNVYPTRKPPGLYGGSDFQVVPISLKIGVYPFFGSLNHESGAKNFFTTFQYKKHPNIHTESARHVYRMPSWLDICLYMPNFIGSFWMEFVWYITEKKSSTHRFNWCGL